MTDAQFEIWAKTITDRQKTIRLISVLVALVFTSGIIMAGLVAINHKTSWQDVVLAVVSPPAIVLVCFSGYVGIIKVVIIMAYRQIEKNIENRRAKGKNK